MCTELTETDRVHLWLGFRHGNRLAPKQAFTELRWLARACGATLAALTLHGGEPRLESMPNYRLRVVAAVGKVTEQQQQQQRRRRHPPGRVLRERPIKRAHRLALPCLRQGRVSSDLMHFRFCVAKGARPAGFRTGHQGRVRSDCLTERQMVWRACQAVSSAALIC